MFGWSSRNCHRALSAVLNKSRIGRFEQRLARAKFVCFSQVTSSGRTIENAASTLARTSTLKHGNVFPRAVQKRQQTTQARVAKDVTSALAESARLLPGVDRVSVRWRDGAEDQFPYVWLRDNCQCEKCFHPVSKSRLFLMQDLDAEIKPTKAEVNGDGSHLYITWPDGHVSPYPVTWLHERRFGDEARQRRLDLINVEYETWGNEFQDKVPTPDFMKVMEDDKELLSFLYNLDKYGLILMKNVPRKEGQVQRLAERVRFVKNTHYGKEFIVRVKDDPNNAAYTAAKLGLHVDLPFYSHAPGIQMLHCVNQAQGKGGENQFVDGFHVAEQLKRTDPESFKLMTDVCVDFYDLGEEDGRKFYKILRQPLFSKDESGERIVRINYNDQVRDTHLSIPIEKVQPLYRAIKKYNTLMYDPNNYVELKMAGGEMVVFNNVRVLHGRAGYEGAQSGGRLLYGAYIAWDEAKCRLRVLQQEYGTPPS